jgi:hypothetical protein
MRSIFRIFNAILWLGLWLIVVINSGILATSNPDPVSFSAQLAGQAFIPLALALAIDSSIRRRKRKNEQQINFPP